MVRKITPVLIGIFILVFILFCVTLNVDAYDIEKIISYHSYIRVHQDGSITVTETIKVNGTGQQIKHGIYRDFPTKYKDRFGNKYTVDFEVIEVLRDGYAEGYHFGSLSNGKRIYIGRKDFLLPPGEYTYTFKYKTTRQLGFFEDFDELYWNVTGNGWNFPIDEVSATVELPGIRPEKIIGVDGYTGLQGSKEKNFSSALDYYGNVVFKTTRPLGPKEGLTIVVSWPKGYLQEPTMQMKIQYFINDNRSVIVGLVGLLILLAYYLFVWNIFGRDPSKGTIIPLYDPPNKLSPAAIRYIMKMGYDNKSFTAAVINMAVKGYLTIKEKENVYTLKKTGAKESNLTTEELSIARKLFGHMDEIELKNTNHKKVHDAIVSIKQSLNNNFERIYFFTNKEYFIPGLIFSILVVITSGALDAEQKLPIAIFMSIWLTIWSFGVIALLNNVILLWKGIISGGSNKISSFGQAIFSSLFALPFIAGEIFGIVMLIHATSVAVAIIMLVLVFVNLIFYNLLKAPTFTGRKIMDKIEGFKMYLAVAEKDRLSILNPPEQTPELFERYLSYALALDVEQAWSQKFSNVLARTADSGRTYSPGWYSGTSWSSLGAVGFASGLGGSLSSAISSSSSAPGSSSGSGGGGSSGGGGGGGGGGGW